jgi:small-conductance mechanosensitive channel
MTNDANQSAVQEKKLEVEIREKEIELKNAKRHLKNFLIIFGVIFVLNLLFIYICLQTNTDISVVIGVDMIIFINLLIFGWSNQMTVDNIQEELEKLNVKRKISSYFADTTSDQRGNGTPSYFDRLVQINLVNLDDYYRLVKVHTNNSFRIATSAGVVGFLLIVFGLIIGFFDKEVGTQGLTYISAGSGVLTEFISGIFFYLYNRTVRQLKSYHDSLLVVQNILLSFKIIEDIKDETEKVKVAGKMLEYLMASGLSLTGSKNASSGNKQ